MTQPVTGVAIDTTGAVLPNAGVVLTATRGGALQQTTTDAAGNFRFDAVPQGRYGVRVAFEGFQPTPGDGSQPTEPCQHVSTSPERESTYFVTSLNSFAMPP
jgi:Carboxypeptidase regulatory-like domain